MIESPIYSYQHSNWWIQNS